VHQKLINSDPNVTADNACRIVASLNAAQFVAGHRVVGHHFSTITELLRLLIKSSRFVAEFLNAADQINPKVRVLNPDKIKYLTLLFRTNLHTLAMICIEQYLTYFMARVYFHRMREKCWTFWHT
jgi:hypothetical protein